MSDFVFCRPSLREANLAEVLLLHQRDVSDDVGASVRLIVESSLKALRIEEKHLLSVTDQNWVLSDRFWWNEKFQQHGNVLLEWTRFASVYQRWETIRWSWMLILSPKQCRRRFLTDDEVEKLGGNLRLFKDAPTVPKHDEFDQISLLEVEFELVWSLGWRIMGKESIEDQSLPLEKRINAVLVDRKVVRRFARESDGAIPLVDVTKSVLENYQELHPRAYVVVKSNDVCCVIEECDPEKGGHEVIIWQGVRIWSKVAYDLGKDDVLPVPSLCNSVLWYNHLVIANRILPSLAGVDVPIEELGPGHAEPQLISMIMIHLPSCRIVDLRNELMGIGARVVVSEDGFADVGKFRYFEGAPVLDGDHRDQELLSRRAEYRRMRSSQDVKFSTEESTRLEVRRKLEWTEFRIVARNRCLGQIWTPEAHFWFPSLYRRFVIDLLLCHQKTETSFSSLPKDVVLYEILPFVDGLGVYSGYSDEMKWFYRLDEIRRLGKDCNDSSSEFLEAIEQLGAWSSLLSGEQLANASLPTLDEWMGDGICVLKPGFMSCSQCRGVLKSLGSDSFLEYLLKLLVSVLHCPLQTKLQTYLRPLFFSHVLSLTAHLLQTHPQRGGDGFHQVLDRLEDSMKELLLNWKGHPCCVRKQPGVIRMLVSLLDAFVIKSGSCSFFCDPNVMRVVFEVATQNHKVAIDGSSLIARILESYVFSPRSGCLRQCVIDATAHLVSCVGRESNWDHIPLSSILPRIYVEVPDLRFAMLSKLQDDHEGRLNGIGLWGQFWPFFLENCRDLDPQTDEEQSAVVQMFVNFLGHSESILGVDLRIACSSLIWLVSESNLGPKIVCSAIFQWIDSVLQRVFGTALFESILDLLRATLQLPQSSFDFDLDKVFCYVTDVRCCWPIRLQETVAVFVKGARRLGDLRAEFIRWEKLGSARDSLQTSAPFVQLPGRSEFLEMHRQLADTPEIQHGWSISAICAVQRDLEQENPTFSIEDVRTIFDLLGERDVDGLPIGFGHPVIQPSVAHVTSIALEEGLARFAKFLLEKFPTAEVESLLPECEVRRLLLRASLFCPQQFSTTPQSDLYTSVFELLLARSSEIRGDLISTLCGRLSEFPDCLCLRGRLLDVAVGVFDSMTFPWKDIVSLLAEGLSSTSEHVRASFSPILAFFREDPTRLSHVAAALKESCLDCSEQFLLLSKLFAVLDDSQWTISTGLRVFISEFHRVISEYDVIDTDFEKQKTVLTFLNKIQFQSEEQLREDDGIGGPHAHAVDFLKILIPKKHHPTFDSYLKKHLPILLKIIAMGSNSLLAYFAELVHSAIEPSWDFDLPEQTRDVIGALLQRFDEITAEWTSAEKRIMRELRSFVDEFIPRQRRRRGGRASRRETEFLDCDSASKQQLPSDANQIPAFTFQDVSVPTFDEPSSSVFPNDVENDVEPLVSYLDLDFGFPDVDDAGEHESEGESRPYGAGIEGCLDGLSAPTATDEDPIFLLSEPSFDAPLSSSFVFDFGDSLEPDKNPFDLMADSASESPSTEPAFGLEQLETFDFDATSLIEEDGEEGKESE